MVNVSRETFFREFGIDEKKIEKLKLYEYELIKELEIQQIISKNDKSLIWNRHILDSLVTMFHVKHYNIKALDDIGSGGGFPGIVLAVVSEKTQVRMFERKVKKCKFLNRVKSFLELDNAVVTCADYFEKQNPSQYAVSRAVFGKIEKNKVYKKIAENGLFFNYSNEKKTFSNMKEVEKIEYTLPGEAKSRFLFTYSRCQR
ncbi:class I SAM-dependent methyltransferase [candidate division WOR-3 bacterium]|nr:class I SAM-dependent methyltransferase [candidate division WOR-3 bacterium]